MLYSINLYVSLYTRNMRHLKQKSTVAQINMVAVNLQTHLWHLEVTYNYELCRYTYIPTNCIYAVSQVIYLTN